MKTPYTPFLPHLAGCLFGRPRRSLQDQLRAQAERIEVDSLGKLNGLFGNYIPDRLLCPTARGEGSRRRFFSIRTSFWAFLAQVLSPSGSCREALRKLQAWQTAQELPMAGTSTSAYCQARKRLSIPLLRQIHRQVAQEVSRRHSRSELGFSRPVKLIDGTSASMPDTKENQKQWPQTKAQKPGCGFPFVKLVALFDLSSAVLLDWVEGNKHDNENKLAQPLWEHTRAGDIVLADRGFCSYSNIAVLQQRGVDVAMRLHQARDVDFRSGKRLGHRDRLFQWHKPLQRTGQWTKSQWNELAETLSVRIVHVPVRVPGFRVEHFILATTLTDPVQWPVEKLARLYFLRWSVELFFRDIKTTMGMDVLRCKSPDMIRKEIIMHVIAYNCIRGVMQHAAALYCTPVARISLKGTIDTLRQWADAFHIHAHKPRKHAQLTARLMFILAHDALPHRPERSEPRVKKRRPKGYQWMTKPRREMIVSASRRWS